MPLAGARASFSISVVFGPAADAGESATRAGPGDPRDPETTTVAGRPFSKLGLLISQTSPRQKFAVKWLTKR